MGKNICIVTILGRYKNLSPFSHLHDLLTLSTFIQKLLSFNPKTSTCIQIVTKHTFASHTSKKILSKILINTNVEISKIDLLLRM
jgi:hypothetical protein